MKTSRAFTTVLFLFLGVLASQGDDQPYPRPDLLVEPAALAQPETATRFIILDTRDPESFVKGHVPGARRVDPTAWAKAFKDTQDVAGWSQRTGELGLSLKKPIILYGDKPTPEVARIWWILRYWGFEDVRLLNGGWASYQAQSFPTETGVAKLYEASKPNLNLRVERLATKAHLLDALKKDSLQIIDARTEGEFCGTRSLSKRSGAIPGAKHLEWSDLLEESAQRFKSPAALRQLFQQAGIDVNKPTATYCQSGGRSSVMAFGLELMGGKDVRNYYASWSEWGNATDTPTVTNQPKKKPLKD